MRLAQWKRRDEARDLVLTLDATNCNILKWYVDAAHTVHDDMKGHTGKTLKIGKGHIFSKSTKQKLNTRSSTETELVGVDDVMPQILWTNNFIKAQGWDYSETIIYQDNKSAILLEKNGKASSSQRTKHINIRYFFIKDQVDKGNMKIEFLGTKDMIADFFSKPLTGKKFIEFRNQIMNIEEQDLQNNMADN